MKKKVTLTCILKSGEIIEETVKIDKKNKQAFRAINEMRNGLENSLGYKEPVCSNITFGKLTITISEIAAIKFKEN